MEKEKLFLVNSVALVIIFLGIVMFGAYDFLKYGNEFLLLTIPLAILSIILFSSHLHIYNKYLLNEEALNTLKKELISNSILVIIFILWIPIFLLGNRGSMIGYGFFLELISLIAVPLWFIISIILSVSLYKKAKSS